MQSSQEDSLTLLTLQVQANAVDKEGIAVEVINGTSNPVKTKEVA